MVVPKVDHDCVLQDVVVEQANRIAHLEHQLAQLMKSHVGPKSERSRKMPRPTPKAPASPAERAATRMQRAAIKAELPSVRIDHRVPDAERSCPKCGSERLKPLGDGKKTVVFEFVPARFIRHEHVQEVLACRCGDYVVTAPGAPKVVEKGRYGASFLAHLATAKCVDHLPIYRLEKDFARRGIPIARSTMNELLHRASAITEPLWRLVLENIRHRHVVQADETRMRMLDDGHGKPKNGFVWTFVAADDDGDLDVALVFAADRSGETPKRVLGDTRGYLVVDAYSGYNAIVDVSRRIRVGCHAHLRRYFHEILPTTPVAQEALDLVQALYLVERDATERALTGASHLEFRKRNAAPIRDRLREWLERHRDGTPPRSSFGRAIRYGLNHWDDLGRFLEDDRIPIDNNASERALRRVALGRKNFLFVGDVDAGTNIAGLYTLVATCEARGINPFAYLADVIARVQDHPADRVHELLPGPWAHAAG